MRSFLVQEGQTAQIRRRWWAALRRSHHINPKALANNLVTHRHGVLPSPRGATLFELAFSRLLGGALGTCAHRDLLVGSLARQYLGNCGRMVFRPVAQFGRMWAVVELTSSSTTNFSVLGVCSHGILVSTYVQAGVKSGAYVFSNDSA